MTISSGDLAQNYSMRHRSTSLKQDITRLTTELATGQIASPKQTLVGNLSHLMNIEHKMNLLDGYSVASSEAANLSSTMQGVLGHVSELNQQASHSLIAAGTGPIGASHGAVAATARDTLQAVVNAINSDAAGRRMFAGTATDQKPLVSSEKLLIDLKSALSGVNDPDQMIIAAQAWFDDLAGFDSLAYKGAADPLAPFALSPENSVRLDVRANDSRLKAVIGGLAIAALADDPQFALAPNSQSDLFARAGKILVDAGDGLTGLRAQIGVAEARIDSAAARNAAEKASLGHAKSALLSVDPYEAATRLEEVQFQLESLYAVTVRMSQLSLVNFL